MNKVQVNVIEHEMVRHDKPLDFHIRVSVEYIIPCRLKIGPWKRIENPSGSGVTSQAELTGHEPFMRYRKHIDDFKEAEDKISLED